MQFETVIRIPTLEEEERDAFYENEYNARYAHEDSAGEYQRQPDGGGGCGGQAQLEQSYERDSRWKPHLSWSYLSWKLQQRMEEQAAQRELAWQKIADKLGPLIIADGGLTFGRGDYTSEGINERAQERAPFYSQKLSYSNNTSKLSQNSSSHTATSKPFSQTKSSTIAHTLIHSEKHEKAKRRCMTVGGILIALILLLFTLVLLMALGILHR